MSTKPFDSVFGAPGSADDLHRTLSGAAASLERGNISTPERSGPSDVDGGRRAAENPGANVRFVAPPRLSADPRRHRAA